MFTEPYMQRALLAALLIAPLCGFLGVFVTARRLAFFSDTVSHSALAGVGVGAWLGLAQPTWPMIGVGLAVAAAVLWLKENTELLTDTIMALLLSGSVAVGIILLSLRRTNLGDIHRFLFGDILAIGPADLWLGVVLFAAVTAGAFARLSDLVLLTAHEEIAHACGVRVRCLNYIFVAALTLVVAVSIRLLGILLVTALVVIPAAAARNVSRNLRQHIVWSLTFGLVGGVGGTALAYELDVPCGPMIVVTCISLFLITLGFARRAR